jgi:hypothetical protein
MIFISQVSTFFSNKITCLNLNYLNINLDASSIDDDFINKIRSFFYLPIKAALSPYNFSPFRIMPPRVQPIEDGILVSSGFLPVAEPISKLNTINYLFLLFHFNSMFIIKEQFRVIPKKSSINLDIIKEKLNAASPEYCAERCIGSSILDTATYKCLSFDYCDDPKGSGKICAFYNSSLITNPDDEIILGAKCDHYSSNLLIFFQN